MRSHLGVTVLSLALTLIGCGSSQPNEPAPQGSDPSGADEERVCSTIGCTDGLTVRVSPPAPWPHGAYRFTIVADGATTTCTGTLPLAECGTSSVECEGPEVGVTQSGCALPASQHAFGDLMFENSPTELSVEVALDGRSIGEQSWTPEYQTSQPNGPECEPTCRNGTVELPLSFE